MEFRDNRKKRIVYISSCIINQNLRFPGIAITSGAVVEVIEPLLKNGLGIEQLPCLERLGWGGISRKTYFRFQPLVFRFVGSSLFPIIKYFTKIWLHNFSRLCKKEAVRVINQMEDYLKSGYSILGIIAMNDSPTCGATKTMDLLESASKCKGLGLVEEFEHPKLEKMSSIIPSLCDDGSGLFMVEVLREIKKRRMEIKVIGLNPWGNLKKESEKITNILGL